MYLLGFLSSLQGRRRECHNFKAQFRIFCLKEPSGTARIGEQCEIAEKVVTRDIRPDEGRRGAAESAPISATAGPTIDGVRSRSAYGAAASVSPPPATPPLRIRLVDHRVGVVARSRRFGSRRLPCDVAVLSGGTPACRGRRTLGVPVPFQGPDVSGQVRSRCGTMHQASASPAVHALLAGIVADESPQSQRRMLSLGWVLWAAPFLLSLGTSLRVPPLSAWCPDGCVGCSYSQRVRADWSREALMSGDAAMGYERAEAEKDRWLHVAHMADAVVRLADCLDGDVLADDGNTASLPALLRRLDASQFLLCADAVKAHASRPEGRSESEHSRYVNTALANAADALVEYWAVR